jgi:phosphoglycerol transferase MdoB-like AlkP superfamily enzyme
MITKDGDFTQIHLEKIREITNKIFRSESVCGYLNVLSLYLIVSVFIRIISPLLYLMERTAPENFAVSQFVGCYDDFIFLIYLLLILAPIYFVFFLAIGKRSANSFAIVVLVFYLIAELLLNWYFSLSMAPFTYHTLHGVSSEQASQVAAIYGFEKSYLFFLIPVSVMLFIGFWWIIKIVDRIRLKKVAVLILFGTLISSVFVQVKAANFENELNYLSARNKVSSYLESYLIYRAEKNQFENLNEDVELKKFYALNEINKMENYDYPFFSESEVRNPLGPFFPKRDSAPNIVFIICESLGKQFSGDEARLGSFTPFLDSLAGHSLYWSNFMANAERTFGALPNILGGLPEGETGFMNLRYDMPNHFSLPQLLKENNDYQTAFFCGANKEFDHMDEFLMAEKFDAIKSKPDFKLNQSKTEINDKNGNKKLFNWGAEDKDVFAQSFHIIDTCFQSDQPYCNVYLTTSFHEPFNYSNKDFFSQQAKKRIEELEPVNKADYLGEVETFAALMYMDFALKQFIRQYQTRPDFENTIFVICGDHAIKFLGNDTRLEKFHVPLLIYSPMLLKPKRIKSMACHKDIPSAIQGLLKGNFGQNLPAFPISQSDNLKTDEKFETTNNNHILMFAERRMNAFVWKDYLLMEDVLYRIKDNLKIEQVDDEQILDNLKDRISNYRLISQYVCYQNKWIPDSFFENYTEINYIQKTKLDFEWFDSNESLYANNLITSGQAYSGNKSLTNSGQRYLNLLKNISLDGKDRVRLKMRFAIKSVDGNFPALIVTQKELVDGHENEITKKTFLLNESNPDFVKSEKEDWYYVELGFWFNKAENLNREQKVDVYLFENSGVQFFVDDLEIELREF